MFEKLYKAVQDNTITVQDLSEKYKVSNRTVRRWLNNESKPKVEIQYELNNLVEKNELYQLKKSFSEEESILKSQIDNLLIGLRESFHRWGKYSSRNEALEELSKLILAQISLIKNGKKGFHEFSNCGKDSKTNTIFIQEINDAISLLLKDIKDNQILNGAIKISIVPEQSSLIKEICQEFKKVNWSLIESISRLDLFNEIFGRFLANSFVDEKEMGQYLTPIEMTRFMVSLCISTLSNKEYTTLIHPEKCVNFGYILDPSCGAGSFLVEIIHQLLPDVMEKYGEQKANQWIQNMGNHVLFGIDKSNRMARLTLFSFSTLGIPTTNIYSINSLDLSKNKELLRQQLEGKVNLILTNPPFGAEFSGNTLIQYQLFTSWANRKPKKIDSELLFIERYVEWLKDGGYCITVVPDSVLTNRGLFHDLRKGIHPFIELQSIISFPSETFSAAGTSTKTSVMSFVKSNQQIGGTYFGICKNIGYKVITKGSNKVKISTGESDLESILIEMIREDTQLKFGRRIDFDDSYHRWDANYHASLNESEYSIINNPSENCILLSDVADLVNDRIDPRRIYSTEFNYIEISDILPSGLVKSKTIKSIEAPSRARKRVQLGDVLASTVRPEQRKIGYIIDRKDQNSICTTGLAVLRPKNISSSLLVSLLKSDFVTKQLLRNNIGIAYPAIDENCFLDVILPITKYDISELNEKSNTLEELQIKLIENQSNYLNQIQSKVVGWLSSHNLS